jgi:hypothetical protein
MTDLKIYTAIGAVALFCGDADPQVSFRNLKLFEQQRRLKLTTILDNVTAGQVNLWKRLKGMRRRRSSKTRQDHFTSGFKIVLPCRQRLFHAGYTGFLFRALASCLGKKTVEKRLNGMRRSSSSSKQHHCTDRFKIVLPLKATCQAVPTSDNDHDNRHGECFRRRVRKTLASPRAPALLEA